LLFPFPETGGYGDAYSLHKNTVGNACGGSPLLKMHKKAVENFCVFFAETLEKSFYLWYNKKAN